MISERIGNLVRHRLLVIGRALARVGFTPNLLTVIGVLLNLGVAAVIASDHPQLGGFLLLVARAFDMLDGAVARATGLTSDFGGFLDSTLDRYSEALVYGGILIYLLDNGDRVRFRARAVENGPVEVSCSIESDATTPLRRYRCEAENVMGADHLAFVRLSVLPVRG